jgi:hypothetical protein
VNGHWSAAKIIFIPAYFFIDAAIGRAIGALLKLKIRIYLMSNVTFGFIVFLVSITIFTVMLVGGAALFSGHVALAILLVCMFGMGTGVSMIERN